MPAVGILGGTFDPIHLGHLVLAEAARETFALDRVIFVPAGWPPHKSVRAMAPAESRFHLVELAIADNPHFALSRLELERAGPSYTVDTVAALRAAEPGFDLRLIMGSDALVEIQTWRDWQRLLDLVEVLAAARPGTALAIPGDLRPWSDRIHPFYPPALEISSTAIREALRSGRSIRYLVPAAVEERLRWDGLYLGDQKEQFRSV